MRQLILPDRRVTCTSTTYENIEAVKKMILANHCINIRDLAVDVDILFGSCQAIFTDDLSMKHAKLLNFEQKQCRMDIAQEMLTTFNDDLDLLKRVITGSKSFQISLTTFILIFYTKLITVSMIHFFFFGE